jgi:hypothetical protein
LYRDPHTEQPTQHAQYVSTLSKRSRSLTVAGSLPGKCVTAPNQLARGARAHARRRLTFTRFGGSVCSTELMSAPAPALQICVSAPASDLQSSCRVLIMTRISLSTWSCVFLHTWTDR